MQWAYKWSGHTRAVGIYVQWAYTGAGHLRGLGIYGGWANKWQERQTEIDDAGWLKMVAWGNIIKATDPEREVRDL